MGRSERLNGYDPLDLPLFARYSDYVITIVQYIYSEIA